MWLFSQSLGSKTDVSNCVLLQEEQILFELMQITMLSWKQEYSEFANSGGIR